MNKRLTLAALVALVLAALALTAPAIVSAANREIKTAVGQLTDIDWAGSKIVVRWLSQDDNTFHDVAITVPDDAKIRTGAEEISFSELETPEDVTVKYYEEPDGTATLINLSVTAQD
ncbi:MAG: hypothetical protein WCY23_05350 [Candidatus Omnitrophota bacterium]